MKDNVYSDMINGHREVVKKAWELLAPKLSSLDDYTRKKITKLIEAHDLSRFSDEEFYTFIEVRMSSNIDMDEVDDKIRLARLIHINTTPYNWQYYQVLTDDGEYDELDMPYEYVVEMVCDHIASYHELLTDYDFKYFKYFHVELSPKSEEYYEELKPLITKVLQELKGYFRV